MSRYFKKASNVFFIISAIILQLFVVQAEAQTDSVYWDFGTTISETIQASTSSNANVAASNCIADTGNVCCIPFTSGGSYTPPYLTNNFSSAGQYTGASGEPTLRNNAKSGSFNASTSTYLSFRIEPNAGYALTIKGIEFGARSIFFGPANYVIRTSIDGFSANVGTGSLSTSGYGGAKKTHTGLSITESHSTPVEVRVYAYGGFSTTTSGNFFMDDVVISYEADFDGACDTPAVPANLIYSSVTFYSAFFNWNSLGDALSYEYALTTSATPPASGTNITDTFKYVSGLDGSTTYYFHVRSMCDTFASGWETVYFTTSATPDCDTPANKSVTNITISGAYIEWNSVNSSLGYQIALTTSATPPAYGGATTDTFYTASYLDDNTQYYFHLRNICLDTFLYSDWVTLGFTTIEDTTTDTFKIVTYNLLNFGGSGRETYYRTIMDSIDADIVVVQELTSSTGFNNFLSNVLNYTTSTYSGATFINGPDTDNGLYYRSSKFQFISNTAISTSLRDINQFKLKHIPSQDTLIIYSVHLKAGSSGSDATQRAGEVDDLRAVTDALDSGKYFLVCGDFNIYGSSESAYTKLKQNGSNANGKFNDIISMSGTWNNSSYAIHHTQSPRTSSFGGGATGGLDDRFDMLLFSNAIISTGGFDILSGSYLAFGNDGQHYNSALNTPPYTAYPSAMLSAIHDASDHLPVVVQLRYNNSLAKPGRAASIAMADNNNENDKFSVYPNPAENVLFVKTNVALEGHEQLTLYSTSGNVVKRFSVKGAPGTIISVDISGVAAGVYYLGINGLEVHKIVIQ